MSVINQMLKDLEQRSPESNSVAAQPANVAQGHSPINIVMLTAVSVLVVCLISFYVWQLISENNALKAEQISNKVLNTQLIQTKQITEVSVATAATDNRAPVDSQTTAETELHSIPSNQPATSVHQQPVQQGITASNKPAQVTEVAANAITTINTPIVKENIGVSLVTPAKKVSTTAKVEDVGHANSHNALERKTAVKPQSKAKINKMSVSRRQLSADELAQQKIARAEKALAAKQIDKAEKLLEDAIIIKPSDSQTRKKLAALWFGRQAYQDALNLLSQGIALNGKDSSLREMKARIHLKQGQVTAAVDTLKPLAKLKDEQYQVMLANTAQQAQQNTIAVGAYKMLITMQPDMGRWQLGLAVLYDKNSQFTLASEAYRSALTKNDLSISSEKFVKQRIQAIGQ